jgi:pSer/pThr/pTyr-binding forkhead associated (FHA) protein
MFQVIVRGPDGAEATYTLAPDQGILIGREAGCDVVLDSKRVSRRHARLFADGSRLCIEDMGSQNGIFVGGARLSEGVSEIRPGPPIEVGEFKILVKRLDPNAATVMQAPAATNVLKGTGALEGRQLELPRDRGFVGREPGQPLSIENDSVSRRHAEVVAEGTGHTLTDLGSSNGTFVNGERLSPSVPRKLRAGDKVRFGETHWLYGPALPAAAPANGRTKRLIAVGVAMVLLIVVAKAVQAPEEEAAAQAAAEGAVDKDELLASAQRSLDEERFEEARRAFADVLKADPLEEAALEGKRKAELEAASQKRFQDGDQKAKLGRDEEALERYFEIDRESRFFARARLKVQELAGPIMRKLAADCREGGRKKATQKVLEACGTYLDYKCHTGVDEDALKYLREAEKSAHTTSAWLCPPKLAPFFGTGGSGQASDGTRELAARYDDKELREAVGVYVKGDVEAAIKALGKLKGKSPVAADVFEKLQTVSGRFKEGDSAWRAGRNREMQAAFDAALEADGKVVPEGLVSFRAREMRTRVAKVYFESGKSAYDKQSYVEAYEQWAKGLEYMRTDSALLDGLGKLERAAADLLGDSPDCDTLGRVARMTRDDPPSPAHEKAKKLLAANCE